MNLPRVLSWLVPLQVDGAESIQGAPGAPHVSIAPGQIAAQAPAADKVAGIIGPIEHRAFHRAEVRLDEIEPAGVRRLRNHGDPMLPVESPQEGMAVGIEVVHDHIQPLPTGVAGAQPPKGRHEIPGRLPTTARPHQTVAMDIVEPQELLRALGAAVRGPLAAGVAHARQPDPGDRAQFQRPPLVETDHRSAPRPPLVEAEDARFLLRTPGRAKPSRS